MSLSYIPCCGLLDHLDSSSGYPAVSVHYLSTTFLQEVEDYGFSRNTNLYQIEDLSKDEYGVIRQRTANMTCPVDGKRGSSYIHALKGRDNVGDAKYMLSYTWGYTIGDIIDTLIDFCESTKQSPKRTYVWMCCLCVNQHRVVDLRKEGKVVPFSEFSTTFFKRVKGIKHVLSMMTTWDDPGYLRRAWCIYEMYVATASSECTVSILMPPGEKHSFAKDIQDGRGGNIFFTVLSKTDIENASAYPKDKELIMRAVNEGPGAHKLNVVINDLLIEWSKKAILDVIEFREQTINVHGSEEEFARFLRKVGLLFWKQGFYDEALKQQGRALAIQKRVLGDTHIETARTYNDMGMTFSNLNRNEEALEYCKRALTIRENIGENDKDTAQSYSTVAMRLKGLGQLDEALKMVMKALEIRQKVYKTDYHADICRSKITIGRVLAAKKDHEGALEYFHRAVSIAQSVKDERLEARALDDMGSSYQELGKQRESNDAYKKCLVIREKILGSNHKLTTKISNILLESSL